VEHGMELIVEVPSHVCEPICDLTTKTSNDEDNGKVQIKKMCVVDIGGLMTVNHKKKNK
jgi:hypothetical protein